MLEPAQLQRDQINALFIGTWYDPEYKYYTMSTGNEEFKIPDSNEQRHVFASVDKSGRVLGMISYTVDWQTMSTSSFGAIAFQKFNHTFLKDLRQVIEDIFFKYNMNRLSFYSVADNPHVPSYKRFVAKYGGIVCGYERQCCKLIDGDLHDVISFEIMAEDFKKNYKRRAKK